MLELGEFEVQEHELIGRHILDTQIDYLLLFGKLTPCIKEMLAKDSSFSGKVFWYETHQEISEYLNKILQPGDVLLIKGSRGMRMELVLNNLTNVEKE
jgi:UDP-N-acetylmuramoyl-tripeptide--D-alanyl-D-alanine ligase